MSTGGTYSTKEKRTKCVRRRRIVCIMCASVGEVSRAPAELMSVGARDSAQILILEQ